ncbi:NAD(P)H-hydrate dehydratase [Croceicoccus gelatinilyticus]|uniref:NAD(P)H-hydrate dehydratase n=1 Tax=Croceicoccus gelatinilyticus TaxID=2835536 RepID=UPI001BCFE661|nr:NAD(P)H-hydrate dehydratase [Croceicoccus gelatinilyticus]MBS7670425.1 NAD(P)H-hydrate dehydratase [Croceicoccus gelatinilyticus]
MLAPDQVLTVRQMVSAEERLMAAGTDVHELMQRAGRGAAEYVWRMAAGAPVTVLCGPGNNGGDGYVIAEAIRERGGAVQVVAAREPATDAAKRAASLHGGPVVEAAQAEGAIFVDCLFGTGLSRALSEEMSHLLLDLASRHERAIAIDMPSGIESDSGALLASELPHYALCIALGAWKQAHFLMPAMATWDMARLVDIGADRENGGSLAVTKPHLIRPAPDAHKYRRGLVAVVGGAMPGAALLASQAAAHAGAAYVKLVSQQKIANAPADLVTVKAPGDASFGKMAGDERVSALLVGPGLGRDAKASERLGQGLSLDRPTVIDADGLTILRAAMLDGRKAPLVMTPHEGELATLEKLFGLASDAAKHERARALAGAAKSVVIAKGPDTVIAAPDGRLAFAGKASSWLSVAGTGDVLAGLTAARLAVTGDPWQAANEAVWLHAEAAHLAGPAFTAGQLADHVRSALESCL